MTTPTTVFKHSNNMAKSTNANYDTTTAVSGPHQPHLPMKDGNAARLSPINDEDMPLFEKFLDMLNDLDDVQNVYHNAEV